MVRGHLRSSHTSESCPDFSPYPEERGKEVKNTIWGSEGTGSSPQHDQKHDLCSCPISKEKTKLYHGLQQRWHWHSDAASAVSVHPLIAPLFCQFPSEDLSSGKRSKLVPAGIFFFFLSVSQRSSIPRTFWKENFRPRGRALSREICLPLSMEICSEHFYLYYFRNIRPLLIQSFQNSVIQKYQKY